MYPFKGREPLVVWVSRIYPASSAQDVPVGVGLQGLQGLRPVEEQPLAPFHLHGDERKLMQSTAQQDMCSPFRLNIAFPWHVKQVPQRSLNAQNLSGESKSR